MVARVHRLLLRLYRRLPTKGRRWVVRTMSPSYTVGSICLIERADGAVLLVNQSYRKRWGIPGGLLRRGEDPAACARREVLEETGLDIELTGEPSVVVESGPQRVDVVFRARPAAGADPDSVEPCSPEIRAVRWFPADDLPELQRETALGLMAVARSSSSAASAASPADTPTPALDSSRRP